jgi:hypothetical protein
MLTYNVAYSPYSKTLDFRINLFFYVTFYFIITTLREIIFARFTGGHMHLLEILYTGRVYAPKMF